MKPTSDSYNTLLPAKFNASIITSKIYRVTHEKREESKR